MIFTETISSWSSTLSIKYQPIDEYAEYVQKYAKYIYTFKKTILLITFFLIYLLKATNRKETTGPTSLNTSVNCSSVNSYGMFPT